MAEVDTNEVSPQSYKDWKALARKRLECESCVFKRNQSITEQYAKAYLRHSALFKWAGMAAFASHHIRLALRPFALSRGGGGSLPDKSTGLRNVSFLKATNDAIYEDIYWAHLATMEVPLDLNDYL